MAKKFIFFKKQISEITDIKETVKALEKISAANVHNLKMTSQKMLNYETALKKIFSDILGRYVSHQLFRKNPGSKNLCIILTTKEGLCGNILNQLLDFFQPNLKEKNEILVVGEKGRKLLEERDIKVNYFFPAWKDVPKEEDVEEIKNFIISRFLSQEYSEIFIFYPKFETIAIQKPTLFKFLPFDKEKFKAEMGEEFKELSGYPIFEPDKREITDYLIREYLGLAFYQKVLETKLSELSARTMAMEEADDKAGELINQLSYRYFREKREVVTKDINELYSHRIIK